MKTLWAFMLAAVVTVGANAQDPAVAKPDSPKAMADKLQEEFQSHLLAEFQKYQAAQAKKAEEAKAKDEPIPAMSMRPKLDLGDFPVRFAAAAKKYAGTDDAIEFLMMSLQTAQFSDDKSAAKKALDTLAEHHLESKEIGELLRMVPYIGRSILGDNKDYSWISEKIEKENKHPSVKALAMYIPVERTLESAPTDSDDYASARKVAMQAAELTDDEAFKARVLGQLRGREAFGNGKVAPDIAGVDLDGVAFKLSDYKGKVIFLDFWGDW